jgi:hypothetical protein
MVDRRFGTITSPLILRRKGPTLRRLSHAKRSNPTATNLMNNFETDVVYTDQPVESWKSILLDTVVFVAILAFIGTLFWLVGIGAF